jgi:hypothetical protein
MKLFQNRMKICVLVCVFTLSFSAAAFADQLDTLVGASNAAALREKGAITKAADKATSPVLLPQNAATQETVSGTINALNPSMVTETLRLYKKPAGASSPWTNAEKTALYNESLALNTLAGLQYYSESHKSMRTFYEISQVIDDPSRKKPVTLPFYGEIPASLTIYARQKDLTFGDNVYHYEYTVYGDALIFTQQNLTTLSAGIVPAVGKNKLRSVVAVIDAGDFLLVYAASFAKTVSIPGMRERIEASFSNRANAVLGWWTKQADKAYAAVK